MLRDYGYADQIIQGFEKGEVFVSDILTFIFDMEKVLLQPANSLLQSAKKSKDLNKVLLLLQDLGKDGRKAYCRN